MAKSFIKTSFSMSAGTFISRILGFVKNALLVSAVGVSAGVADSFQLANTLPNTVYNLLAAGTLNAIFVPQIIKALKQKSGQAYVNRLLTLAGLIVFVLTVVCLLLSPLLVTINAASLTPEAKSLAVTFSLLCLPQIFFYGLYNIIGELLNAKSIFSPFMWAPVINNIIAILGLVVFLALWGSSGTVRPIEGFTTSQILVLAGFATLGVVLQAVYLFIPLRRHRVELRLDFHFRGTDFRSASKVAIWTFSSLLVSQVGILSTNNLAAKASSYTTTTGEVVASLQAYNYGFLVYMLPQSLISLTLATVVFTSLAHRVSEGNWSKVAATYESGINLIVMLSFGAAAVIIALAHPIMQIILYNYDSSAVTLYSGVLVALIPALSSTGIVLLSNRLFYALEEAKPVFLLGIIPTLIQVIVGWGLYFITEASFWTVGAAAAETACRITQGFMAIAWCAYVVPRINVGRLIYCYFSYLISFGLAGFVGYRVLVLFGEESSSSSAWLRLLDSGWKIVVVGALILFIYFLLIKWTNPKGYQDLDRLFLQKLKRRLKHG